MEVADGGVLCLLSYIETSLLAVLPLSGIFWRHWLVQHDKMDSSKSTFLEGTDVRYESKADISQ